MTVVVCLRFLCCTELYMRAENFIQSWCFVHLLNYVWYTSGNCVCVDLILLVNSLRRTKTDCSRCRLFFFRSTPLIPNTHRRRWRDSTVELSCVASASAVCIEFATSSRRLPMKIWKLNMLRIYLVELSRVELCRRCVRTRRLSWPSLQFCSLCDWRRKLETGSRLTTAAFTPPTRRNST